MCLGFVFALATRIFTAARVSRRDAAWRMTGSGYQPEQQRDQGSVGPGDFRPGTLAELALRHGELMLEQQDLRGSGGD